jgi:OOP family OmpA-OmpF porin
MRIHPTLVALLIGAALCGTSGPARAQADWYGWYLGATLGASNANITAEIVPVVGATSSVFLTDSRDPGYKVFAGYRFNRHFAVEGGYAGLGEFQATTQVTSPTAGTLNADIRVIGLFFDAVGLLPVGERFAAFGKVGVLLSETRTTRSTFGTVTPAPGLNANASTDRPNLSYGLGVQYDAGKNVTLRVVWERYIDVGDANTGEFNIDLYSGGLLFRF